MLREEESSKQEHFKLLSTGGQKGLSPVLMNNKKTLSQTVHLRNSATYVNLQVNNITTRTLIDSGAESTLLSKKLAEKLKLKIMADDGSTIYVAANGQPLKIVGWTLLRFNIGKFEMTQKCVIIENLSTDFLLGTDTLVHYGMIINY